MWRNGGYGATGSRPWCMDRTPLLWMNSLGINGDMYAPWNLIIFFSGVRKFQIRGLMELKYFRMELCIGSTKLHRFTRSAAPEVTWAFPRSSVVLDWSRSNDWIHPPVQLPLHSGPTLSWPWVSVSLGFLFSWWAWFILGLPWNLINQPNCVLQHSGRRRLCSPRRHWRRKWPTSLEAIRSSPQEGRGPCPVSQLLLRFNPSQNSFTLWYEF